jgi:signal transduction histidine kinase
VPERCAIDELFADTVELFTPRAEAAGVRIAAAPTRASVHGDRERLLEVLANLVGNALQHTPRGGAIDLRARAVASSIRCEVADTGPGLTAEDAAHVFERHWQARRGGGGLGLGLYICRRLVEAHHGSIGVDSEPGRGATFWFEVPVDVVT